MLRPPPRRIFALRGMVRLRQSLVRQMAASVNRMIKCRRMANINLEHAVTDVTGKTGFRIIDAVIGGERDPLALAGMRDKRCRKKKKKKKWEIARCLDGVYSAHTVMELKCHRAIFGAIQSQIEELDNNILAYLKEFESGPDKPGEEGSAPRGQVPAGKGTAPCSPPPVGKAVDLMAPEIARILGNGGDLSCRPGISD
ncbi:MAG: hypothetical protein LBQ12_01020, partial [Deltaproteobacteria bacterium]|nr:hypothetical protein [Deltaproteobacteria bacterium]